MIIIMMSEYHAVTINSTTKSYHFSIKYITHTNLSRLNHVRPQTMEINEYGFHLLHHYDVILLKLI